MTHSDRCASCETLPDAIPVAGTLYLAAPLEYTQQTIAVTMRGQGLEISVPESNVLKVGFKRDELPRALQLLSERLSTGEAEETRILLVRAGDAPALSSFLMADRLTTLFKRSRSRWLIDVLATNALVTHFQPIVHSADTGLIFGYEALTRGVASDGEVIPPSRLYDAAVTANLLYHLDRSARVGAIRAADRHHIDSKLFINFTPSSIYTPAFCLRSTTAAMRRTTLTPAQIVFEVVETERISDMTHLKGILEVYREQGFGIALDDLGVGFASLELLYALRPDYVKLDLSLVRDVDTDHYKATIASKLLEVAQSLGIASVAEGVETQAEAHWLTENGATYQQGFLFAHPATPPPTKLSKTMAA